MYSFTEDNFKEYNELQSNNVIENEEYSTNQSLESHLTLNNSFNKLTEKSGSKDSFISDFSKNEIDIKKRSKNDDQEFIVHSINDDIKKNDSEKSINHNSLKKVKKNLFLSLDNIVDNEKFQVKNLSNKNKESFNINKMFECQGNHFNKLYNDLSNVKQSTPKYSTKMDGLFSPKLSDEKIENGSNMVNSQTQNVSPLNLNFKNNNLAFSAINKINNCDKLIKIRKLGEGTFGNVYLVKNKDNNFYALKKYFNNTKETDMRFRLQKIVKLIRILNHCSLPDFYETFLINNHNFVITDYYEYNFDETVKKIHQDKNLDTNNKQKLLESISLQVINSIIYLHENKIVHRDLKPSNLMINKSGKIKLIDLDFAKKLHNEEIKISMPIGTTFYKAPELILGQNDYSYSQDIWSLGCIIAEIYLGVPLFESKNEIETLFLIKDFSEKSNSVGNFQKLYKIKADLFNSNTISSNLSFDRNLNEIDINIRDFIENCLSLDPNQRFDHTKKENLVFIKNLENIEFKIISNYINIE